MIGESLTVSTRQATVLLLGSDQLVLQILQEALEARGYVVLPAGDLARAVDWLSRCKPDLLLVRPYLSGGIAGHDAALYLRTKSHGIRIMIVSGFPDDERILTRSSLHQIEIFPQPFTAEEFTQKVAEVLDSQPASTV